VSKPEIELSEGESGRSAFVWRWSVCGLLLLATMLNYMDRQTLSLTVSTIRKELKLSNEQYGDLELGFGLAFATGAIVTGWLVDRLSARWMYPIVLIGWSLAGIATARAIDVGQFLLSLYPAGADPPEGVSQIDHAGYVGLLACRIALGFFEAGQWPCALVTTQRILTRGDRTFGNSLLQSGASIGAIITPFVVLALVKPAEPGTWRLPFYVIGAAGMLWAVPWLLLVKSRHLRVDATIEKSKEPQANRQMTTSELVVRFAVLLVVVITINMTWQFFRAWLPLFLGEYHKYSFKTVNYFTSAYYVATDAGCIAAGIAASGLARMGWSVHTARVATFTFCTLLTSLSAAAAFMPKGWPLLGVLLLIGFGALGLFPNYYSFTQDLSKKHQGKVTGILGAATWVVTAFMHKSVGRYVDESGSYKLGILFIGMAPVVACIVLWLFWRPGSREKAA
jgi:ACS family hexuronate transporter-like MFS transporter